MKGLHLGHCVIGGVIAVVVLLVLGVPVNALFVGLVLAACPLMMLLMMRMMMNTGQQHDDQTDVPT
jgi:hypothetical protein